MDPQALTDDRTRIAELDLNRAISLGMTPPPLGTTGIYHQPGKSPVTFRIVGVNGMICHCRYSYTPATAEPSSFIWGFGILRGKPEYNNLHRWPGHPDW